MKNLIVIFVFAFALLSCASLKAQVEFHSDLNIRVPENSAWKVAHLELYKKSMDSIKSYKNSIRDDWTVISAVQTQIYTSLTDVDEAIKDGKRVKKIAKLVPAIAKNIMTASSIAIGKPYLMVYYNSTVSVLTGEVIKLQEYITKFIFSKGKKELMMDQTQRDILLTEILGHVQAIYNITTNMCVLFKEYTLQQAINKIFPYKYYISLDKGIVDNLLNRMKF